MRLILRSALILLLSVIVWSVLLLNPSLSYAHETPFDGVTVYHNYELEKGTELLVTNALKIIKNADIYDESITIELCLNDDKIYPNLHPFAGATAYAFSNKTVIYASKPNFSENVADFKWEVNGYELRKYNLTRLLAHEFMHNVQSYYNVNYYIKSTLGEPNWKLEGHAEYIAREFRNDGRLKDKIERYLTEKEKQHIGIPVLELEDGTIQNLSYFKYALVIQYLMEVKDFDFDQVCSLDSSIDESYAEMIEWLKDER